MVPTPSGAAGGSTGEERPLLAVVGSGDRTYREYILRSVSAAYRLWLMGPAVPTWERPYIEGSTLVDDTGPGPLAAAAVIS